MIGKINGLMGRYGRFGWLIGAQSATFIISISGFAVLSRVLGPVPFARFAFIILIFTLVALVTDFASQSFVLVNGASRDSRHIARLLSFVSAGAGLLLFLLSTALVEVWNPTAFSFPEVGLLCIALLAQIVMQVPRAVIIVAARYRIIAIADVAGVILGVIASILISQTDFASISLVAQLAISAVAKMVVILIVSPWVFVKEVAPRINNFRDALRFAFRVIPLNAASYLSRSLDSGLLPSIVPAVAAAGYARSYQVVIAPVAQIQLALGPVILNKLSIDFRDNNGSPGVMAQRVWVLLRWISFAAASLIIVSSTLIQIVLFGPNWGSVNITIAAMAVCLPGIAIASYGSWTAQIIGTRKKTWGHVISVLSTPSSVVVIAILCGFPQALLASVIIGGLIQPLLLCFVHRGCVPLSGGKAAVSIASQWVVLVSMLGAVYAIAA